MPKGQEISDFSLATILQTLSWLYTMGAESPRSRNLLEDKSKKTAVRRNDAHENECF